jgi:hypothetical protein
MEDARCSIGHFDIAGGLTFANPVAQPTAETVVVCLRCGAEFQRVEIPWIDTPSLAYSRSASSHSLLAFFLSSRPKFHLFFLSHLVIVYAA